MTTGPFTRLSDTDSSTTTGTSTTYTQVSQTAQSRIVGLAVTATRWGAFVVRWAKKILQWVRETVTPVGWLVVVFGLLGFPLGLFLGWDELVIAGSVSFILIVFAIPFLLGGRSYDVEFSLPADRVVAGTPVAAKISVTNSSTTPQLPGRVDVPIGQGLAEVAVPLLMPNASIEETIEVPAHRRGVIDVGPVRTVRSDPIGVLKREISWADVQRVFVHPQTVSVPSTSAGFIRDLEGNPTSDLVDSDISFHAIRQYMPGDGQRHIHWKSTAKTGQLMVRQFEESRRERIVIILGLNPEEYANEDEFEMAVSAAGSLGVRAIRDGRDLAVVVSSEIMAVAKKTVRSIQRLGITSPRNLLDDLSLVESSSATMPLDQVCELTAQAIHDMSVAFVMCGSTMTAQKIQALRLRLPAGVSLAAVVCNPEDEPKYREISGIAVLSIGMLDDFRRLLSRKISA